MYALNNPRRFQARVQSKPFGISAYEHVELLVPDKEIAGQKPFALARWEEEREARMGAPGYVKGAYSPDDDEGASKVGTTGRVWRTRRRRDGKVSCGVFFFFFEWFFFFGGVYRLGKRV